MMEEVTRKEKFTLFSTPPLLLPEEFERKTVWAERRHPCPRMGKGMAGLGIRETWQEGKGEL